MMMKLSEFDYSLPKELIAERPTTPRDHSRLLVLDKETGELSHHLFYQIENFLKPGDLLIYNNSKVFPARLIGHKIRTLGSVELLLNKKIDDNCWEAMGKNVKVGNKIGFPQSKLEAFVQEKKELTYIIRFNMSKELFFQEIEKIGQVPLPPYIKRSSDKSDRSNYQTIYAQKVGSAAAPTAGLHFTKELIKKITKKGVEIEEITLHVGLGTFAPIKSDDISNHKMHSEYFFVSKEVIEKIRNAQKEGRRVIAVGTTTTRVLEHIVEEIKSQSLKDISDWTEIFITPGYKFQCIDALITNFHLPKSTLLLLVSAFAGRKNIQKSYKEAVDKKYRFFSYGDAMFIQ